MPRGPCLVVAVDTIDGTTSSTFDAFVYLPERTPTILDIDVFKSQSKGDMDET